MLNREKVLKEINIKDNNGFSFEELANISKINLRGEILDINFTVNVEKALNIPLPQQSNTSNKNNLLKIIWLSPNEWLIEIFNTQDFNNIFINLKDLLNPQNTSITDVTENKTILRLKGVHLFKLLSKFMIIDLNKAMYKESSVAQTIFIKVPVLIIRNYKNKEEQSIDLHVNRSHAQYIINLLIDGSKNINF